jgi:hypothetical protein
MMQNVNNVDIARYNPGVEVRIPMHGIFCAQPMIKRIRIRQNLGIEEMVKA